MIGKVAKCKRGKLGIICRKAKNPQTGKISYFGIGFDGGNWQSSNPEIVAENIDAYIYKIRKPLKTIIGIR